MEYEVEKLLKYKQYVEKLEGGYAELREEAPRISERLKIATSHRDKKAHRRAYQDLHGILRTVLRRTPKHMDFPLIEKPKELKQLFKREMSKNEPIPLVNRHGEIDMGCPWCPEWIDVTRVFTERMFSAQYKCSNGHWVVFGGVEVPVETAPVSGGPQATVTGAQLA